MNIRGRLILALSEGKAFYPLSGVIPKPAPLGADFYIYQHFSSYHHDNQALFADLLHFYQKILP